MHRGLLFTKHGRDSFDPGSSSSFDRDEKGIVTKTEIAKGIGAGCDEAASWAVSKAKFIPGKQRGKPVKVRVSIPIRFRIK